MNDRSTSPTARRGGERGASSTEYGLLVAFIGLVIVGGTAAFGASVNDWFDRLAAALAGIL